MGRFSRNRLTLQLIFAFAAAVSVAALSVLLIREAIRSADRVVLGEALKTVGAAANEMRQQYEYRAASDSFWPSLPASARDVSLRAISNTVLRSYPGVEGGYYADSRSADSKFPGSHFLGYAYPTHDTGSPKIDVPESERELIVALAQQSLKTKQMVSRIVRGHTDVLVLEAVADDRQVVTWAMKRLAGRSAAGGARQALLSGLVLAALISIAGTLATGLSFARGVMQIKRGVSAMEHDADFRLPERSDEFGGISSSINRMASVRRKLETELRREDRLRALGRLTASLAHEIRNPLNGIRLTVQLLEHRLKSGAIRAEDLATVRTEVDRLNDLVTDLLDLQRSRQPRRKLQPVVAVLEHCIGLVERQAAMQSTQILLESPAGALTAVFDEQQLTQTVVNLLLNALEASQPGGTIQVRACRSNGSTRVQIEDEGTGLDAEQQEHLFEPFFTTKPGGTGLGLAVSRELMRSQGGDLVYTATGKGAAFIVQLPEA